MKHGPWIILFLLAIGAGAATAADKSPSPAPDDDFSPVLSILEHSGGLLTPEVRTAYLAWQERTVLRKLSEAHQPISTDCIGEVLQDSTLRDAFFGAIDPPDPSILENYAVLRAALGPAFTAKYRSLVIADAIARRTNGARTRPDPNFAGEGEQARIPLPQKSEPIVCGIAAFMTQTGLSPLELFQNKDERQKLVTFLQAQEIDAHSISGINHSDDFHHLLKGALILLGQRPAVRDLPPDPAAWLHYLASIYEARPAPPAQLKLDHPIPWPRFPIDGAPWPLLMPLYHAYPLTEARYIWETYQGLHGSDRYHTYGPYETGVPEWRLELRPSPWNWNAWPDVIVHGGDCTVMAPMAVETHVALCEPAMMAGQPGHSNLMSFRNSGKSWFTVIEQAFAGGPDVTAGAWLFNEIGTAPGIDSQNDRPWVSSEYQIGLTQAMNFGLSQYIDTRIAVNLYHHLPRTEGAAIGDALLSQAIRTNPFNPAPWYLLAKRPTTPSQIAALSSLASEESRTTGQGVPKPVTDSVHDYWDLVQSKVIREAMKALQRSAGETTSVKPGFQVLLGYCGAGRSWRDVTEVLQKSVKDNVLQVAWKQPYTEIGGDPAFGKIKTLLISYRIDGKIKMAAIREQDSSAGLTATIN